MGCLAQNLTRSVCYLGKRLTTSWLVACGPSYHPPLYKSARRNAPTRGFASGWNSAYLHDSPGSAKHSAPGPQWENWSERDLVRGFEVLGVQGMMPMGLGLMSDLGGGGGSARMTVKLVLLMIREGAATSESGGGGDGLSAG